jgi:hypothetical protein
MFMDSVAVIQDYLTLAQDLEQFGVTYFEVTNKKGSRLWLGVHCFGMDIYHYNNKSAPRPSPLPAGLLPLDSSN